MADVNYSLMLGLSKDRVRGLCVLTVRYPQQPFKNYVAYSKQPIHHHPKWLQEKIQTSSPNFVKHTEITLALNVHQFRTYFSKDSLQFMFKGSRLVTGADENKKFLEAELRMKNAVQKRQATRAANKQRRLAQDDDAANQSVLEHLASLFKSAPL